jgi:low temperature requirement protein LtrA
VATPEPDTAAPPPAIEPAIRVSTLELFFDLVFVFTLTQLTNAFVRDLALVTAAQVLLMLGVIWWMYGGYAWLTNAVAPSSTTRRTLLLTGMAGFLIIALAIPDAFGESGWLFGVGYFVVNLVHTTLFIHADRGDVATAIRSLGPLNFVSATLILVGGFTPGAFRYVLWALAFVLQVATPYLHRIQLLSINTGHFVERHGLVIIVAIGESIVAVGLGFAGIDLDFGAVAVAVLGLCISYYLWWAYFAGDDERSEHALAAITEPLRRTRVAVRGWAYAHFPMVLGIVVLAAGVKKAVGHAFEPLGWGPATAIAVGVALFLLGHAWFLRILRIDGVVHRLAAAAGVLATIPLGHVFAVAQLAVIPLIMATAMIIEDIPRLRRSGTTSIHDFGRGA